MAYYDDSFTQKANLSYIRTSMNEPLLEKEYELNLARQWRDHNDIAAMQELVRSYTRLVISAAGKFRHYGLPMSDLIQEGNIGLMQAVERFDPERDIRFSTYASWWIRSCMQDYVLKNWSIVRTGTTAAQKALFFNFRRLRAQIEREQGYEGLDDTSREKIGKQLKASMKDVKSMEMRLHANDQSLNAPITNSEDDADEWQNFLPDDAPNPEDIVIGMKDSQARSKWLNDALEHLSDREQKIIRDRHLTYDGITLEELGSQLGVSKERVRQLESRAFKKIRQQLLETSNSPRDLIADHSAR